MLSRRTQWDLGANSLARRLAAMRRTGRPILDLTCANPTACGLSYPQVPILGALTDTRAMRYQPDPRGDERARVAVSRYYAGRGVDVCPSHIVLTASTSEAYSWLFKLLADPGDAVCVPRPSYPLFAYLAGLESVEPVPYAIAFDGRWAIDLATVRGAMGPRSRAIVVVSPNNPTGNLLGADERSEVAALCRSRGVALVCDEVFSDYVTVPGSAAPARTLASALVDAPVLTFVLSGLSKVAGLPQLKLGWIAVGGPPDEVAAVLQRLDFVADTYLSVNTPVQCALPRLLELAPGIQDQVRRRVAAHRAWIEARQGPQAPWRLLPAQGGWYAVLEVPRTATEEDLVLGLLEDEGVLVHPGYFFDFSREGYLVVSLLVPSDVLEEGLGRVLARIERPA